MCWLWDGGGRVGVLSFDLSNLQSESLRFRKKKKKKRKKKEERKKNTSSHSSEHDSLYYGYRNQEVLC